MAVGVKELVQLVGWTDGWERLMEGCYLELKHDWTILIF